MSRRRRPVVHGAESRQHARVPRKTWNELSPRTRRFLIVGGAFEGVLKVAALADLVRRPPSQVNGSKPKWAAAIVLVNSVGAVPIAYFTWGRRQP
jgi:hypothetical protein